jgi:hypothetical protein
VKEHYVNASTAECNETGRIGTLVITPNDDTGTAAVVVVAAYGSLRDPSLCLPPAYASCIVARRRFAFIENQTLNLPIALDPDCANVPCDAFSTCSKGKCVDSAIECLDGSCTEPGQADGGADGGGVDVIVPGQARCDGRNLFCWSGGAEVACGLPNECCAPKGEATCGAPGSCGVARYCCVDTDCPSGRCMQPGDVGNGLDIPDGGGPDLDSGQDLDGGSPPADGGPSDSGGPPADGGAPDGGVPPSDGGAPDGGGPRVGLGFCVP